MYGDTKAIIKVLHITMKWHKMQKVVFTFATTKKRMHSEIGYIAFAQMMAELKKK
jgi:hypothetical protein